MSQGGGKHASSNASTARDGAGASSARPRADSIDKAGAKTGDKTGVNARADARDKDNVGPHDDANAGPDANVPASGIAGVGSNASAWCLIAAAAIVLIGVLLEHPRWDATFVPARVFFSGPDDYMRGYRARKIADGDALRIKHMAEINGPAGAELHWTAPMDYLLAGAWHVFRPLMHHPDSFGAIIAVVPVGLGAAYLACLIAYMRRGFGWTPALLAGLVVALSPAFHRAFQLGHPDHHCLLELLFVLAVGSLIPRARADGTPGTPSSSSAWMGGLAIGLGIWVAPQALLIWLAILLGLSWASITGAADSRRRWTRFRLVWCVGVALVVSVGFVVENWPDWNSVTVDKISLLHLALAGIAFLAPGTRFATAPAGTKLRSGAPQRAGAPDDCGEQSRTTLTIALLTAVAAFVLWIKFQSHDVFKHISSPEFMRWSAEVAELQPLYVKTARDFALDRLHINLGYVLYVLPIALLFFIRSPRVPRPARVTCGLLAVALATLSVRQVRWLDHYNLGVVPVLVVGVCEMIRRVFPRSAGTRPVALLVLAGLLLAGLLIPAARNVLSRDAKGEIYARRFTHRADFVSLKIAEQEAALPSDDSDRRAILCDDADGPVLLYYTGLPVISVTYHRAIEGLLEAARFFAETDVVAARKQLDRLNVRYIVVPPHAGESLALYEKIAFGELRSFDPPEESINESGRLQQTMKPRRHMLETMIHRLVMLRDPGIPGVERVADIREGARTPDGLSGLLYRVSDVPAADSASRPTTTQAETKPASE